LLEMPDVEDGELLALHAPPDGLLVHRVLNKLNPTCRIS
jgi:hypothetical protein